MATSSAHGSSPRPGIVARPVVAVLLIVLPLLVAGIYALVSGNAVSASSSTGSSETSTPAADGETTTPASADPLAKTRTALTSASLPLTLLSSGLTQLTDAAPQLTGGVTQLSDGLGQARTGSVQLADGAGQLDAGFGQLRGGITQLGDGAQQISGGVDQVTTPLLAIGDKQAQVTAAIADVATKIEGVNNPITTDAANQLRGLIDTLNTQGVGPSTVDQLNQLRDGAKLLAFQLADSSSDFNVGVSQLADGASQLSTGNAQLRDGIVQLDDGGKQLKAGTDQIGTAVTPINGVITSLQTNVKTATDSLPAASATSAATTTTGDGTTQTTVVVGSGDTGAQNYLLAALVAVGAVAGVSLLRLLARGGRLARLAPVVAVLALTAAASIAYVYVGNDLGFGGVIGGIAFLLLSAAAFLAAAGAIQVLFGRAIGQSVNLVLLLVQLVVCGAAFVGSPDSSVFGKAASFTPLGWVGTGLDRIASGSIGGDGLMAVIVMVAVLGLSGLVYAVINRSDEPRDARYA
ncbi:phage infection protein [Actinomycetes bacterium M1A6_2h]